MIKEIIVVSDGSTDGTVEAVKSVDDPRIELIESRRRVGKSSHLNSLFCIAVGDIIVLLDADVLLASADTISKLIGPFSEDAQVGLVGGNLVPVKAKSFMEEAVKVTREAYQSVRIQWREGNNVFGCEGGILALSKEFARQVTVPFDMIANDQFLYFSCITKGFEFRHVQTAKAWYRTPNTLKDQILQNKRFVAVPMRLKRIFGEIAVKEYRVPKMLFINAFFSQFTRKPIHSMYIFLVNRYCKFLSKRNEEIMDAKWPIAITTKSGIEYEK